MKNYSKNTAIALSQLSLFSCSKQIEQPEQRSDNQDNKPWTLQIGYIPDKNRTKPDKVCRLIRHESKLNLREQFSHSQAKKILETTRYWDFSLDKYGMPRCLERLRSLLESVCSHARQGGEANA